MKRMGVFSLENRELGKRDGYFVAFLVSDLLTCVCVFNADD